MICSFSNALIANAISSIRAFSAAPANGESMQWVQACGRGRIRSFTIIRHPVSKAYASEVPYAVALVELEEGPTMMSALTDCDPENVTIGQPVEVVFERWTREITMPKFRPAHAH